MPLSPEHRVANAVTALDELWENRITAAGKGLKPWFVLAGPAHKWSCRRRSGKNREIERLALCPLAQNINKTSRMGRCFHDFFRCCFRQNLVAVRSLGISTFPGIASSISRVVQNIIFGNLLDPWVSWRRTIPVALTEEFHQSIPISQKPGLHALDHEMALLICRIFGAGPLIGSLSEMLPCSGCLHWPFGVHEKHSVSTLMGGHEFFECSLAGATGHDARHHFTQPRFFDESSETFAAFSPK